MSNLEFQEYMQQANVLMGQEKYEQAVLYLEKAEQIDKLNIDIYLSKGIAYANISDLNNAKKEFEKALKINRKEGLVYFHLGNIEMLEGNKAQGIEFYNNAIAYGFDDAQVYFSLGLMYEEEDKDDFAIRNYSKAILKDPNRADIRIRKIRLFIKNQKLNEALHGLDELILSNPDIFEGYHLKYLVLTSMQKYDEADKVLDEAITLFPKDPAFAIDKASLLTSRKKYHEAIEMLQEIEKNYEMEIEDKHSIAMEKARVFAFLEDMDNTINSLQEARKISLEYEPPRMDLEALYLLMNCYLNNENFEEVYKCAVELKKAKGEDYYSLAAWYYEPLSLKLMGKTEEAMNLFKAAVEYLRSVSIKNPEIIDSYAFRIMALRELKDYEKALELANYLIDVRDDLAESYTLRATILDDMGRSEEAKEDRAKAVSIGGMMAELPANN